MASIYARGNILWLKFRNECGETERVSTNCRKNIKVEARRAQQMRAEYEIKELSIAKSSRQQISSWRWVTEFLQITYNTKPTTLERYSDAWRMIAIYLKEKNIQVPAQLLRHHCFDYMMWRQKPDSKQSKYHAGHNTALLELRILRIIMNEAVIRGYCTGNPCVKLHIKKAAQKKAPKLTNDLIDLIRKKIQEVENAELKNFLAVSFEIGRYQGCRLSETRVNPQTDVTFFTKDTKDGPVIRGEIRFVGKGQKEFITMLHPALFPLFKKLKAEGKTSTWDAPAVKSNRTWASSQWTKFLMRSGLKDICPNISHRSTRVTVATRMAENNVPLSKAKEYIKHASTTMHFVYQRLQPEDLSDCADAVL
jgi:site-specific recombinase XerD